MDMTICHPGIFNLLYLHNMETFHIFKTREGKTVNKVLWQIA